MGTDGRDITVIICTRDRPESLSETLRALSAGERTGLDVEVIVVDNGAEVAQPRAAEDWDGLRVRYVHEPRPGKTFALNCGIAQEGLGRIVAFLDDDMTPEPRWWQGVAAICRRHPDADFFTGRSHIVWPHDRVPGWARVYAVQSWAHSVLDRGTRDYPFGRGEWPSGNMYWIRRRVFERGFQFDESLEPRYGIGVDAEFILRLAEAGLTGVAGPDAVAGHRVQEALLDLAAIRRRAVRMGRALARIRLDKPDTLRQARLLRDHPVLFRVAAAANLGRWAAAYAVSCAKRDRNRRAIGQLLALLGMAHNIEACMTPRMAVGRGRITGATIADAAPPNAFRRRSATSVKPKVPQRDQSPGWRRH